MVMSNKDNKHVVWGNRFLDYEDWRSDLEAEYPDLSENERINLMHEINASYLDDERTNLDVVVPNGIIAIADIGRWNGRFSGYKMIDSGNIADCLEAPSGCEYNEWYVDEDGEFRSVNTHHDGSHYITYRAFKDDIDDDAKEALCDKLYDGVATQDDIDACTRPLGPDVGKVYGWTFDLNKGVVDEVIADAKNREVVNHTVEDDKILE